MRLMIKLITRHHHTIHTALTQSQYVTQTRTCIALLYSLQTEYPGTFSYEGLISNLICFDQQARLGQRWNDWNWNDLIGRLYVSDWYPRNRKKQNIFSVTRTL